MQKKSTFIHEQTQYFNQNIQKYTFHQTKKHLTLNPFDKHHSYGKYIFEHKEHTFLTSL